VVALGVLLDLFESLTRRFGDGAIQTLAHLQHLLRLDPDVRGPPAYATVGLMDQEARVRKAEAILARSCQVDVGSRAGHPARSHHHDPGLHVADHVVDGVACLDVASLGMDEDGDVVIRNGRECQQLGGHLLGQLRRDLSVDEDRARVEEPLGDLRQEHRAERQALLLGAHGVLPGTAKRNKSSTDCPRARTRG
jgi:hypothetical protein